MPKPVPRITRTEQPINWGRAFLSGAFGAALMMGFLDTFFMLGTTRFSLEVYIGSLITGQPYAVHSWTFGLLANWLLGGIFGIFYAYCFEYVFRRSGARLGTALGLGHALVAALIFFPFFSMAHAQMQTGYLENGFGILGSAIDPATPVLLITGHLLFGATFGTFYGPVRAGRVRMREWEPGAIAEPGDPDAISEEEDARDRFAA
jgi:hypothetical protein